MSKIMDFLGGNAMKGIASGVGAATSVVDGLMANTRRQQQYGDQVKLMGIHQQNQMALNRQMQEIAMENWEKTNYDAQRKQMEKAGLNPALMYGGQGGGGMIAQSGTGGSAASGNAPIPQGLGAMGIGLQQSALTMQQIDSMKAKAELDRAQAGDINKKQPGAIEGQTLQNASTDLSNQLKQFDIKLAEGTVPSQIEITQLKEKQQAAITTIAENDAHISINTNKEQIRKVKAETALAEIQIQSAEAGIKMTKAQTDWYNKEVEYFQKKYELDARRVGAQEAYNKNLKEFQDSMIKQGYWKLGVEGVTNVAKMFMNPTSKITETVSEGMKDKEGGYWNKTTSTKK